MRAGHLKWRITIEKAQFAGDNYGQEKPTFVILDEVDSGLDIDALKVVSHGINLLRTPNQSFMIITHYQRILNYIQPDFVHIMIDGKIVKSGGKELALELEEKGYKGV